jgi:hypothetical protein
MWDSIGDWWERYKERQRELARGVDADRVRSNSRRWKLGYFFLVIAILLGGIRLKLDLSGFWDTIIETLMVGFFVSYVVMYGRYWFEASDIGRPKPKDSPRSSK